MPKMYLSQEDKKTMSTSSNDISDLDLQALVDNTLTEEDRASLMARVKNSPDAQDRLEELLYQKESIKAWWNNKPQN
ncbi:MAG: hypothetical protein ACXW30_02010 [Micavibrio sp.]